MEYVMFSFKTHWPSSKLAKTIKGIKGGKLTFENAKAMGLLSLKNTARARTKMVWNPQSGENPIKTPKAMNNAFFLGESLLLRRS